MQDKPVILMVDDDPEDIYLTKRAFATDDEDIVFKGVGSGVELFEYLNQEKRHSERQSNHYPWLILLDVNIPKEDGFDILKRLKQDSHHGHLPVVMLSTSKTESDVKKAYRLGANSFFTKMVGTSEMKSMAVNICDYWFRYAKVPGGC